MRPIRETIPLDEARQLIDEAMTPIGRIESVALPQSVGRVVARQVISDRDVPPFNRAGMDGYAVVAEDTFGASRYEPKTLRVVEKIYTGEVPTRRLSGGEAAEIATGAPMPDGRRCRGNGRGNRACLSGRRPRFHTRLPSPERRPPGCRHRAGPRSSENRRPAEPEPDWRSRSARPRMEVDVYERPSIAILSTGNEIVEPGQPLAARTNLRHQPFHAEHR